MKHNKNFRTVEIKRDFKTVPLFDNSNISVLSGNLEAPLLKKLKEEVLKLRDNNPIPYNAGLAGAIKEEYIFDPTTVPGLGLFINHMYEVYRDHYKVFQGKESWLSPIWANYQRKHEFNPIHNHTGALSFVIWTQIPYNIEDELNVITTSTSNVTSQFQFVYPSMSNNIGMTNFPVAKTWEGTVLMFPSWLMHTVYPFYTSDDFRISVAGNLFVEGENYKSNPTDDPDRYIAEMKKQAGKL